MNRNGLRSIPRAVSLRMLRKRAGLTQAEVASRTGIHQSTVSELELQRVDPKLSTLQSLASVYGVELDTIVAALRHPAA